MENVVTATPRALFLHTEETVTTVARKAISPICVEDQADSLPRRKSTLNTKEANLGEDHTADPGTTITMETDQRVEDIAKGVTEAIPVIDQQPDTTTDPHPETAADCPVERTDNSQFLTATCTTTKTPSTYYTSIV